MYRGPKFDNTYAPKVISYDPMAEQAAAVKHIESISQGINELSHQQIAALQKAQPTLSDAYEHE